MWLPLSCSKKKIKRPVHRRCSIDQCKTVQKRKNNSRNLPEVVSQKRSFLGELFTHVSGV